MQSSQLEASLQNRGGRRHLGHLRYFVFMTQDGFSLWLRLSECELGPPREIVFD